MAQNERLKNSVSEYDIAFYLQRVSLLIFLIFRKNSGKIFLYEEFLANQKRLEANFCLFSGNFKQPISDLRCQRWKMFAMKCSKLLRRNI